MIDERCAGVTVDSDVPFGAALAVGGGIRALIAIDSASAPQRYGFPFDGTAASLVSRADGSVVTRDAHAASVAVTAISGGAAVAIVGSGAIGCFAGAASR
jgi:hypothetical protein